MIEQECFLQAKSFIRADIERELNLYKEHGQSAGNFLCALGLLCYTEFFGGVKNDKFGRYCAANNFNTFFSYMGPDYSEINTQFNVYDIFRCGLAHEYFIKGEFFQIGLLPKKERRVGLGLEDGKYFFVVAKYYEDLMSAINRLEKELYNR